MIDLELETETLHRSGANLGQGARTMISYSPKKEKKRKERNSQRKRIHAIFLNKVMITPQGRPGGVVVYQYTRKKVLKIPENTQNFPKYLSLTQN